MKSIYQNIRKHLATGAIALAALSPVLMSCSDVLDFDSDREIENPALDEKTDSVFYTLGILKTVQQATDQMVLVNEMRGDLVETNEFTQTALRELANFSAGTTNKYDSAYVYYRIINNCNYYIEHRDTSLTTADRKVAMLEFVQAKSIRAWAYLQLVRTYGEVPFYTKSLTSIQDADEIAAQGKRDLNSIAAELVADLEPYSGYDVPDFQNINMGKLNTSNDDRTYDSKKLMFPVDLVLGDIYLETAQYEKAAQHYYAYLRKNPNPSAMISRAPFEYYPNYRSFSSIREDIDGSSWSACFYSPYMLYTMIPMASNSMWGTTSELPRLFGYNLYSTNPVYGRTGDSYSTIVLQDGVQQDLFVSEREIDPSKAYLELCDAQTYYSPYSASSSIVVANDFGDMRRYSSITTVYMSDDFSYPHVNKFNDGNVCVYRPSTVWLRLAEALNRAGYPDAAFTILKDGFSRNGSLDYYEGRLRPETVEYLKGKLPILNDLDFFTNGYGIHSFGSGKTWGDFSPYQYDMPIYEQVDDSTYVVAYRISIVGDKLTELNKTMGIKNGKTLNDTINAVEDLICDEYALELAFEGHRFSDLCRLARHKNQSSPAAYGANYGSRWLAKKLAFKNPKVDLKNEKNWYLPFSLK